jgi:hypothetical protein
MDRPRVRNLSGRIGHEVEATHPELAITTAPHHGGAALQLQLEFSDTIVLVDDLGEQLEMFDAQEARGFRAQAEIEHRILAETLALLSPIVPDRDRETIAGDLEEQFTTEIQPRNTRLRARLWLFRKTMFCIAYYGVYQRVALLLRGATRRWGARV